MLSNTIRVEFCAGHRLLHHPGKCNRLHGHNYLVEATVSFVDSVPQHKAGYVIDFGDLKRVVKGFVDAEWDHYTLLHKSDPLCSVLNAAQQHVRKMHVHPTAEGMARVLCGVIAGYLVSADLTDSTMHVRVTIWETPNCSATMELSV